MKKLWLFILPLLLLVFLIVPSVSTDGENQTTEGTQETGDSTVRTDESTIQTDENETIEDEEYAGSGSYDEFFEKYTIVYPPVSSDKRIRVVVDGVGGLSDVVNAVVFYTTEGDQVIRHKNKVYILEEDSIAREIGTIWAMGDDAAEYSLHDGDYVFTLDMDLVDITVDYGYINSAYSAGLRYFEFEDSNSVRLEVSHFASKEVRCFVIGPEGKTEVFPVEQP